jgi:Family of unknown function (DUF6132)
MQDWPLKRILLLLFGVTIGAGSGYLYWFFIGCNSGTCLITSKASNSTLYGLVMGGLLAGTVWDYMKKEKKTENKI